MNGRVSGVPTIACSRTGGTMTTYSCGGAKAHAAGGEWCNRGGTCRGGQVLLLDDILVVVGAISRQASSVSQVCTGWRGTGQADLGGERESSLVGSIGNGAGINGGATSNRVASLEDVDKRHSDGTTAVSLHIRGGRRRWLVLVVVGVARVV